MTIMALVIAPVPDGTIAAVDREHITGFYAGIPPSSPGVTADHINIFSSGTVEPNHAVDISDNVLFAGDVEVQGNIWGGGLSNYSKIGSGGDISLVGTAKVITNMPFANAKFPILDKASGNGIKVDTATPTFGFADLLGDQFSKNTGATKPTLAAYNGVVQAWKFSAGDEAYITYHIPHDYVLGTDIFLHIHWSHIGTFVTGGTLTFKATSVYAKGHNQAAFAAPVSGTFAGTASTTQYQHILTEVQYSASSPSGLQVDTDLLEPDGVIELTFEVDANNLTVSEGAVPDPFIHYVDVHYQTTGLIGTKAKAPDFYA